MTKLWGARVGGSFSGTASDISALVLVAWYGGNLNIPMSVIKGGNELLAEEMLKDCKKAGVRLVFGSDVTEVARDGKIVKVRCGGGQEYTSKYVIITAPPNAAKNIVKGLSAQKKNALEAVKYSPLAEVGLHVKNIPKGGELAALLFVGGDIAAYLNQTGDVAGNPEVGTVINVTVNKKKMLNLSDKELVADIAKQLKVVNPDFDPDKDVLGYSIKRWQSGEVHATPGFLSKYGELLREPSGAVYFASDYVSDFPTWAGSVWAGLKSAKEVLAVIGK